MNLDAFQIMIDTAMESFKPDRLVLEFERLGRTVYVNAYMHRLARGLLPFMSLATNYDTAIVRLCSLAKKVEALEKRLGKPIQSPLPSEQPYDKGYFYRIEARDEKDVTLGVEVQFKRISDVFFICRIVRKDLDGFYLLDDPIPVSDDMKEVGPNPNGPGMLYEWNDLGILSGSAGVAIVLDGKVIKSKTTMMA